MCLMYTVSVCASCTQSLYVPHVQSISLILFGIPLTLFVHTHSLCTHSLSLYTPTLTYRVIVSDTQRLPHTENDTQVYVCTQSICAHKCVAVCCSVLQCAAVCHTQRLTRKSIRAHKDFLSAESETLTGDSHIRRHAYMCLCMCTHTDSHTTHRKSLCAHRDVRVSLCMTQHMYLHIETFCVLCVSLCVCTYTGKCITHNTQKHIDRLTHHTQKHIHRLTHNTQKHIHRLTHHTQKHIHRLTHHTQKHIDRLHIHRQM